MSIRPHHTCISVADIDATADWYKTALGFETVRRFQIPSGARVALLEAPGGARIELTEVDDNDEGIAWRTPGEAFETRGFVHLAFEVDDIEATFTQAVDNGASSVWEPRDGQPGVRMAFLHDNEGNLIELFGVSGATTV